jgi:hypothetical protein
MSRMLLAAFLLAASLAPSSLCFARKCSLESEASAPAAPSIAQLRSAFYLRGTGLDGAVRSTTAAERQESLRGHFDFVLATLASRSERSLDVALDRLQFHRGELWSADERAAWGHTLAVRRAVNIRRLRAYQQRGLFPQNEGQANHAVPIFVDAHDTACAVGHLMRESGWGEAVDAIQRANNFVYVTDVASGALVDWVLVSGLTQEEAALIQPAYEPPPFDATMAALIGGGAVVHNGLRYDNFSYMSGVSIIPGEPPVLNQVDLSTYGVAALDESWHSCCGNVLFAAYDDWLFVGAAGFQDIVQTEANENWGIAYSFDVTAELPGRLIAAASVESYPNFHFNGVGGAFGSPAGPGSIDIDVAVYSPPVALPANELASLHLDAESAVSGLLFGVEAKSFTPAHKIRVVTSVDLIGATTFASLTHSFEVIPEPAAVALSLVSLALLPWIARAFRQRRLAYCPVRR